MKLPFLGQICSKFHQQISTIATENILCYRGCKYNRIVPVPIDCPQTSCSKISIVICTYRGNTYVKIYYHYQFPTKPKKALVNCQ